MEDRELVPLSTHLTADGMPIEDFFAAAVGLCHARAELHARDVVVGAINPQSILIGAAGEVQIVFTVVRRKE